jgi:hypothetical protein
MKFALHLGMLARRWGRTFRLSLGERFVELNLQFGYGMMDHCRNLLTQWGGGTAILSPRDLKPDQLTRFADDLKKISHAVTLLDPQFYSPHSDHERLCSHDYWPKEYETEEFWPGAGLSELVDKLAKLNRELGCGAFILPGRHADAITDDWLDYQQLALEEATSRNLSLPLYSTVALSAEAVRNQDQVAALMDRSEAWKPHGYYIVCEHPSGGYLVDDPQWLANVLDIVAGFKLRGAKVILGYCNHQMLIAASAKADAIASGTWMNVRSFPPEKFRAVYEEEIKKRTTWYYCPQALSEFKIPYLDIANRLGILNQLAPSAEFDRSFAAPLFSGAQPSAVQFSEQSSFRHYLTSLKCQVSHAAKASFDETVSHHLQHLDAAESLLTQFHQSGVMGQSRDFTEYLDANRSALTVLQATRGPMLRRRWVSI